MKHFNIVGDSIAKFDSTSHDLMGCFFLLIYSSTLSSDVEFGSSLIGGLEIIRADQTWFGLCLIG